LAGALYQTLNGGVQTLGPATTQAKLTLWAQAPEFADLIDSYLLLGDPATKLALPAVSWRLYLPAVLRR
jgi:hypothetical protein